MEKITLTRADVENAHTYIPLKDKTALAETIARGCIVSVETSLTDDESGEVTALPSRAQEDMMTKRRALMGCLMCYYLRQPFDGWQEDICAPLDLYDQWAGSHVFNQLSRMKYSGAAGLRDKIFDLMEDYRELEKMVNGAIHTLLEHMNDPAARIVQMMNAQLTPESLKAAEAEMKRLSGALQGLEKNGK